MKNLPIILFLITSMPVWAQLDDGTIAPDFTVDDILGVEHSLYEDYLDQGMPVIMDISATCCGPCWNYHESHALKDLYTIFGAHGSNEVQVLFVEGDPNTPTSELEFSNLGNWIEGTPYPIIDNGTIAQLYSIGYFPTVYAICPNRKVYEIRQSNSNDLVSLTEQNCGVSLNGIQNNISLEDTEAAACPIESPKPKVKIINHGTNTITSVKLELFEGESTTPIDEVVWEGNLTPFEEDFAEFSIISNFNPEAEYLVLASEPNNMTDANDALNQATISLVAVNSVQNNFIVKVSTDNFGSDCTWKIKNEAGNTVANGGPYSTHSNTASFELQVQADQEILVEELGCYTLEVNDSYGDGMYVNEPTFFRIVDLQGNIIVNISGDEYSSSISKGFFIENSTTITENSNHFFSIYPNPANEKLNIDFSSTIDLENTTIYVTNMLGKKVIELNNFNTNSIDISSLDNGIYFLNTNLNGKKITEKFVILK